MLDCSYLDNLCFGYYVGALIRRLHELKSLNNKQNELHVQNFHVLIKSVLVKPNLNKKYFSKGIYW
jgi:hypothetical protein